MKHPLNATSCLVIMIAMVLAGCAYSFRSTAQPAATPTQAKVIVLPEQATASPTPLPATPIPATSVPATPVANTPPSPTLMPSATHRPTNTPSPLPILSPSSTPFDISPTSTGNVPASTGSYAVILVKPDDVLNVRQSPNSTSLIIAKYTYSDRNISLTGKQSQAGNIRWVEVGLSGGKTGWINDAYISQAIPTATFCADNRVLTLIAQLTDAFVAKDGAKFAALISPKHGLYLQYLRGGTIVNYTPDKARWLFESTYAANWGLHPGSGLPVKGTFSDEVLPKLLDVLTASYTKNCENVAVGGTTYTAVWPKEYQNINFYSLYRSGPPENELNWRTWLVGVEYVDGQPYLFALNQLIWEP
ncbi:MAG: hypothetical protein M1281_18855 [Chloroflexi bacterium]|nr:hypothetical protein [Chloroflexota bacterium]